MKITLKVIGISLPYLLHYFCTKSNIEISGSKGLISYFKEQKGYLKINCRTGEYVASESPIATLFLNQKTKTSFSTELEKNLLQPYFETFKS